ncbi:MAG: Lrp/AsnC ligand binding domain-containing protein [Xanthomonadales bacterium]|jgi:Lrp/AsnC family leucine-responsive transcriptional regulator|nr:Lrp/AsnC ligand binding domain-containing protein [Xanthomonadales bacterium]
MAKATRKPRPLDRTDRLILKILQEDGRISNVALAKKVNLSATPCLERVRRMERRGFIKGYTALLDPHKVEAGVLVFVEIDLLRNSPDAFRDFRREALKLPELLECHLVSGNFDYLLKARVKDMKQYRELLGEKILALPGVSDSRSYVVMEEVKESTALNVL